MNLFWLDASALAKRYIPEKGSPLVNHLFNRVSTSDMVCLLEGIGEVVSILVRRRNGGVITPRAYRQSVSDLHSEITNRAEVEKIHSTTSQVMISWKFVEKRAINSTDALILKCALDKAVDLRDDGDDLILVSSDLRLIRAAKAEGLITFNPETDDQQTLDSLIN
ncbi:MAG: type II toxin-antitoxin system VapC family toxin [Blastocatellia bacterium]